MSRSTDSMYWSWGITCRTRWARATTILSATCPAIINRICSDRRKSNDRTSITGTIRKWWCLRSSDRWATDAIHWWSITRTTDRTCCSAIETRTSPSIVDWICTCCDKSRNRTNITWTTCEWRCLRTSDGRATDSCYWRRWSIVTRTTGRTCRSSILTTTGPTIIYRIGSYWGKSYDRSSITCTIRKWCCLETSDGRATDTWNGRRSFTRTTWCIRSSILSITAPCPRTTWKSSTDDWSSWATDNGWDISPIIWTRKCLSVIDWITNSINRRIWYNSITWYITLSRLTIECTIITSLSFVSIFYAISTPCDFIRLTLDMRIWSSPICTSILRKVLKGISEYQIVGVSSRWSIDNRITTACIDCTEFLTRIDLVSLGNKSSWPSKWWKRSRSVVVILLCVDHTWEIIYLVFVGIVVFVIIPEGITIPMSELLDWKYLVTTSKIIRTDRWNHGRKCDDTRDDTDNTGVHMVQNKKLVWKWIWCYFTSCWSLEWIRSMFPFLVSFWHILCLSRYIGTLYIFWCDFHIFWSSNRERVTRLCWYHLIRRLFNCRSRGNNLYFGTCSKEHRKREKKENFCFHIYLIMY